MRDRRLVFHLKHFIQSTLTFSCLFFFSLFDTFCYIFSWQTSRFPPKTQKVLSKWNKGRQLTVKLIQYLIIHCSLQHEEKLYFNHTNMNEKQDNISHLYNYIIIMCVSPPHFLFLSRFSVNNYRFYFIV